MIRAYGLTFYATERLLALNVISFGVIFRGQTHEQVPTQRWALLLWSADRTWQCRSQIPGLSAMRSVVRMTDGSMRKLSRCLPLSMRVLPWKCTVWTSISLPCRPLSAPSAYGVHVPVLPKLS